MSNFLDKHPVPWSVSRGHLSEDLTEGDAILDANGKVAISTKDNSGYQSWFEGDVDAFVDLINKIHNVKEEA